MKERCMERPIVTNSKHRDEFYEQAQVARNRAKKTIDNIDRVLGITPEPQQVELAAESSSNPDRLQAASNFLLELDEIVA